MDGVLIINKPAGMTSHDVVARVRRILGERSVGHLGTLDPSATGVLPLVIGRFTRLAQFYNEADKRYEGIIRFGFATDTYDAEGEPQGPPKTVTFSADQLKQAAAKFVGHLEQIPPPFSAKKIGGVPAYKLARRGQEVELKPKQVEVKEFEVLDFDGQQARFKAWVSSGTYLRSLAHDLGQVLGTGAHLGSLSRTAVREFDLEGAHTLEEVAQAASSQTINPMSDNEYYVNSPVGELLIPPRLVLPEYPAVTATPEMLSKFVHGQGVNLPDFSKAKLVRVFAGQQSLIGIARRIAGTLFRPHVVLFSSV